MKSEGGFSSVPLLWYTIDVLPFVGVGSGQFSKTYIWDGSKN